nr:hypothetical protein [Alkalibacterium sp. 20]
MFPLFNAEMTNEIIPFSWKIKNSNPTNNMGMIMRWYFSILSSMSSIAKILYVPKTGA